MKQISLACIILAGISLLVGIFMKIHALPTFFMNTVPSSWLQLTTVFLLAAIALKCCCHHHCRDGKKDGEKNSGDPCCK
jgi:hypothetical protein